MDYCGASKQVIVDLKSTLDEHHLLIGLDEGVKMSFKKTPLRSMTKKAIEEVIEGSKKTESSSEFEDVFDVDYETRL